MRNRSLVSTRSLPDDPLGFIFTDNIAIVNYSHVFLESQYRPNQDQIWQIRIPNGCKMEMTFDVFDLESNDCNDYFSVQISKNQPDIRKHCRTLHKFTVQRRKRVQLWFHADGHVQRKGLYGQYCFSAIRRENETGESEFPCDCNRVQSGSRQRRQRGKYLCIAITVKYFQSALPPPLPLSTRMIKSTGGRRIHGSGEW